MTMRWFIILMLRTFFVSKSKKHFHTKVFMKLIEEQVELPPTGSLVEKTIDPIKEGIIATAVDFINEYEKYKITDYLKLIEEVEEYAALLLDKNDYYKSYKATKAKIHLNKLIILKSLGDKGEITVEECSLHILDFIEEFETI